MAPRKTCPGYSGVTVRADSLGQHLVNDSARDDRLILGLRVRHDRNGGMMAGSCQAVATSCSDTAQSTGSVFSWADEGSLLLQQAHTCAPEKT